MKKSLLFCAIAACAFTANANDYFTVKFNGQEIENGATIEGHAGDPLYGKFIYDAEINVINKIDAPRFMMGNLYYTGNPTMEEAKADMAKWGSLQICYANGGVAGNDNNCTALFEPVGENWASGGTGIMPASSISDKFLWQIHNTMVSTEVASEYKFVFVMYDGESADSKQIPESEFTLNVVFDKNKVAVEGIEAENAPAEYFNMQGVRVAEPENGLYIVRRGQKVSKEYIR